MMMLLTVVSISGASTSKPLNIFIDGEKADLKTAPLLEKGRTLVSLDSGIFELMGVTVTQDKDSILIDSDYTTVEFTLGKQTALIHRKYDFSGIPQTVQLDVGPKQVNGKVFVPIRFAAEGVDAVVEWDGPNFAVLLYVKNKPGTIPVERPADYRVVTSADIQNDAALLKWFDENLLTKGIYHKNVGTKTYILISAGEKPTGGFTVKLDEVTLVAPGSIVLTAQVIKPAPDAMVTQALTYPSILIVIDGEAIKQVQGTIDKESFDSNEKALSFENVKDGDITADSELSSWVEKNKIQAGIHYTGKGEYVYVLVSAGEKPTGGYSVDISKVVQTKPDEAFVNAVVNSPEKDAMVTDVITYPYQVIRIPSDTLKHVGGNIQDPSIDTTTNK